ncbi:hypothetical protein J120_04115 [candidate division TM6 bacterium JCVI TM6SC1]|uniref:YicC family protein n=1 Tax=candidate division TM6 bacterium JCVI TM6SC1 TaxID=1306947 RepID=A0A0D2JDL9_9BACT|nr:hypothetical protein J120_04115 [candidate division TM6 bacterium JCVI TM6SC1]
MRSMTGFTTITIPWLQEKGSKVIITISLKSLNARFFEAVVKAPYPLSLLETDIIKMLKNRLYRASVYLTIHTAMSGALKGTAELSAPVVESYIKAAQELKKQYGFADNLSLNTLFSLPNVFNTEEQTIDEKTKSHVLNYVSELITSLIAIQEQEGSTLKDDLKLRTLSIAEQIDHIERSAFEVLEQQKEKVGSVFHELEGDESKFAQARKDALYGILDKIDIHEEIVRFKSHLQNLILQLDSKEIEKGKRLDFTLQELMREINTITAKCSDAAIGARAINIKVELEKAREQIQNIV